MIGTAVFYRRLNMKRLVAVGGLALVLLNGGHQTHAFCQLTDCMDAAAAEAESHCCQGPSDDCCSNSKAEHCEPSDSGCSPCESIASERHHESCPNPESCWCCQPSAPQQAPSPIEADTVVNVLTTFSATPTVTVDLDSASSEAMDGSVVDSTDQAFDLCVRLCRFLV
ncbi:MAG: hypothetical protein C0485_09540 [Pirellula sp.]|nr:hypothetical protein [Pirellula sp.]